jgi:hypothetical protein
MNMIFRTAEVGRRPALNGNIFSTSLSRKTSYFATRPTGPARDSSHTIAWNNKHNKPPYLSQRYYNTMKQLDLFQFIHKHIPWKHHINSKWPYFTTFLELGTMYKWLIIHFQSFFNCPGYAVKWQDECMNEELYRKRKQSVLAYFNILVSREWRKLKKSCLQYLDSSCSGQGLWQAHKHSNATSVSIKGGEFIYYSY